MTEPKIVGDIDLFENIIDEEIDISESDPDADVGENFLKYRDKKLIFRNCPNLRTIDVSCLGLKGLEIENCPKLGDLNASNNDLKKINLLKANSKLEHISLNNNKLTLFNSHGLHSLKMLDVSSNKLA